MDLGAGREACPLFLGNCIQRRYEAVGFARYLSEPKRSIHGARIGIAGAS